jgi:hypothetical protein
MPRLRPKEYLRQAKQDCIHMQLSQKRLTLACFMLSARIMRRLPSMLSIEMMELK